jgi:hypothetical protein
MHMNDIKKRAFCTVNKTMYNGALYFYFSGKYPASSFRLG